MIQLINFQDTIEPIRAESIDISFVNGDLYFDLAEPFYKQKSLSGSRVSIIGLSDFDRPILNIN